MWHPGMDLRRWNGTVAFRLAREAGAVQRVRVPGHAELMLDAEGRLVGIDWPDERDAPEHVLPAVELDAVGRRASIRLTDPPNARSSLEVAEPRATLQFDEQTCIVGIVLHEAERTLPIALLDELRDGVGEPPERVPLPALSDRPADTVDDWALRHRRGLNVSSAAVLGFASALALDLGGEPIAIAAAGGAAIFLVVLAVVALLSRALGRPVVLAPVRRDDGI